MTELRPTPSNATPRDRHEVVQPARAIANAALCGEHYRLTVRTENFAPAAPGQFVHLSPMPASSDDYRTWDEDDPTRAATSVSRFDLPLLRRAFSIAGLRRTSQGVEIDVIYRVVGTATRWMESLDDEATVSCMGPLGNAFPIEPNKPIAWLVAGGVGLPPMLWLAEALNRAGKRSVAFCGARSADLLPLSTRSDRPPAGDAHQAVHAADEFSRVNTPVVISTDDGSLGFAGHVGHAMAAYAQANPVSPDDLIVYTCGPERMMEHVARLCIDRNIACRVCMERNMACGTGMCQSCVVPVYDPADDQGWRYRLCCTEGPIFDARDIIWNPAGTC